MASENVKALYDYNASEKDELSFKYVLFSNLFFSISKESFSIPFFSRTQKRRCDQTIDQGD